MQQVEIEGKTYQVPNLLGTDIGQRTLQAAKSANQIICCKCRSDIPLRLYVRRCGNGYVLARFPNTGPQHFRDCDDRPSDPTQSGAGYYDTNAIKETDDGFAIRLSVSLRREGKKPNDPGLIDAADTGKPQKKYAKLGLFGLLHFLWETSRLNSWRGADLEGNRKWNDVASRIEKQLKKTTRKSTEMSDLVVLPRTINGSLIAKQLDEIKQKPTSKGSQTQAVELRILIGHLINLKPGKFNSTGIIVEDHKDAFWIGQAELTQAINACPYPSIDRVWNELKLLRNERMERVVVIGRFEHNEKGYLKLIDLRLMVVNKNFIPVDSSYERELADHLVTKYRKFEKPLIYDAEEGIISDFILTDIEPNMSMEVWGMVGNHEYDARKKAKLESYAEKGGVWEWNPKLGIIPNLPDPSL